MPNFTDGEWEAVQEQVTGGFLIKPKSWSRGICTATQRDPHPLNGMGITWEEALANAKLMAQSKAMYRLLVEIKSSEARGVDFTDEIGRIIEKIED